MLLQMLHSTIFSFLSFFFFFLVGYLPITFITTYYISCLYAILVSMPRCTHIYKMYIHVYIHTHLHVYIHAHISICRHIHTQAYPHVWTSDSRGLCLQTSDCSVCTEARLPQLLNCQGRDIEANLFSGLYSRNLELWLKDTHLSCQNFLKNAPYQSPSVNSPIFTHRSFSQ